MKRLIGVFLVAISLAGCSNISEEDYNKILDENKVISEQVQTLTSEKEALQVEYDEYKKETADWSKYTEAEKQSATEVAKRGEEIKKLDSEIEEKNKTIAEKEETIKKLNEDIDKLTNKKQEITSTFTLKNGTYVVGEDIEAGKYNITATSGMGNLIGDVASQQLGMLNEILAAKGQYGYSEGSDTISNLTLKKGDSFEISGNLVIKFDKIS